MSRRDLEAGMSIPGEQGVVGILGHHRSSIGYSFGKFLRISSKMGISCLVEISQLMCPYQGSKVSLEPWDIIGVPLVIHLGNFLRISDKMGISCLIEISKLVCPYQGNKVPLESWDIIEVPLNIHLEKIYASCAQS